MKDIELQIIKETAETFSYKVEEYVWEWDVSYMESIQHHMELLGIEPETVKSLLTPVIMTKLEEELKKANLLDKSKLKTKTRKISYD